MTVKDLIELLNRYPKDYPVFTGLHSDYGQYELSEDYDVYVGFVESQAKYGVVIG